MAQQAAVDSAKVALELHRDPIADRRTHRQLAVKAGNLVTANSTELMTIAQIQPVYVTFSVPAVHLPKIKRHMAAGQLVGHATPQDADSQPANGKLTFVDNAVDAATDTIKLKATFENRTARCGPDSSRASGCASRPCRRRTVLPSRRCRPARTASSCSS